MIRESSPAISRDYETLFRAGAMVTVPDGPLLERFLNAPEPIAHEAFAALVDRHASMVLRTCRQILGDPLRAEDASQATFLVLARKASSIQRLDSVSGWLYGVATRVAVRAKVDEARQRKHELRGALLRDDIGEKRPADAWAELHEELAGLPEKFRVPIMLCHLEGLSYAQAAKHIGCPIRTVQSRLSRGRERLRTRLIRRGIGPALALLTSALVTEPASARAVLEEWKHTTVEAALRFAANTSSAAFLSGTVLAQTEGMLRTMTFPKLKTMAIVSALAGSVVYGLMAFAQPAPKEPSTLTTSPTPEKPTSGYRVTMADGTTVEVVGVSTYPSGPKTWWRPDGTPLDEDPGDLQLHRLADDPTRQVRTILVRVTGLAKESTFKWLPTNISDYWGGGPTKNGKRVPGMEVYIASFPKEQATCAVEVRLASGAWKTEASHGGGGGISFFAGPYKFYYGKAREYQGGTTIAIAQNIVGRDSRVVAIDRDGNVQLPISSSGAGGEVLSLLDVEFRLPPDLLRTYQVQSRAFERLEIQGIAMNPRSPRNNVPETPRHEQPTTRDSLKTAPNPNKDSDGDGLSDWQEIHKYGSDPLKLSTAGDGVSDGDWQRRREFTYSVRSIVKVMPPVNLDALNDDYQDARVLKKTDTFIELEVIHYPLNTNAQTLEGNPDWKRDAARLESHIRPGLTTNWDEAMRKDLIAALRADNIDPDLLNDKTLVREVSRWLFAHSKFINMFDTHYIYYPDGKATIYPGLEERFEQEKGDAAWSTRQQFEHELFGRSMFANRTHGTCTSSATYLTTVLRALGIPTRMVLAIPAVDANDQAQMAMATANLHHRKVRQTILLGVSQAQGYANHTFNEVFVGGRWVRLNYQTLGQNTLDPNYLGLMTHVNTFSDLSEAGLAPTWGKRYALGERDEMFKYGNPYKTEALTDHFGRFAHVENPEIKEHQAITLSRAYWADDPEAPDMIRKGMARRTQGSDSGHIMVHGEEWFDDQPYQQYKIFLQLAGKKFLFKAEGEPDVHGHITMGYFTHPSRGLREIEILIPAQDYAKMKPGIAYTLTPENEVAERTWKTQGPLTIKRPMKP